MQDMFPTTFISCSFVLVGQFKQHHMTEVIRTGEMRMLSVFRALRLLRIVRVIQQMPMFRDSRAKVDSLSVL